MEHKKRSGGRGQAAIEFLTTYGWAIMAVLISIGALSYFDFLSADRYAAVGCGTGGQLECMEVNVEEEGTTRFVFRNNYPVDVFIESLFLYVDGTEYGVAPQTIVPRGASLAVPGPALDVLQLSEGQKVDASMRVTFRGASSTTIYNVTGSVVAKVIKSLCGNGNMDPGEQCDGGALPLQYCVDLGFNSGTLSCTSSCVYDTTQCSMAPSIDICGDGIKGPSEACDTADFGGETCQTLGFDGGMLSCPMTGPGACATIGVGGCYNDPVCGDNICEPPETVFTCLLDCVEYNPNNLIVNPSFESGVGNAWEVETDGVMDVRDDSNPPANGGGNAAKIDIISMGGRMWFKQQNLVLQPDTRYRLFFNSYSRLEYVVTIKVVRQTDPYDDYGLSVTEKPSISGWTEYSYEFVTPNWGTQVNDAMLLFSFDSSVDGETVYLDTVVLEQI